MIKPKNPKISKEETIKAIKVLLSRIGEDYSRAELQDTPLRALDVLDELFKGYSIEPYQVLGDTLEDVVGYDEMVLLKNLKIKSYCEHHLLPFMGRCHIAYIPNKKIVGIGKLALVAEAYAKRLQIQERLTVQIAETIEEVLEPKGVAVVIEANHQCLSYKDASRNDTIMVTDKMLGVFATNAETKLQFCNAIK